MGKIIIFQNICDYCGNKENIEEGSSAFVVKLSVMPAYVRVVQNKSHPYDNKEFSFCSPGCFGEWVKVHVRKTGYLGEDDEN